MKQWSNFILLISFISQIFGNQSTQHTFQYDYNDIPSSTHIIDLEKNAPSLRKEFLEPAPTIPSPQPSTTISYNKNHHDYVPLYDRFGRIRHFTAAQFKALFMYRFKRSPEQVLALKELFCTDEFIKFAQTLPGYEDLIIENYQSTHEKWFIHRAALFLFSDYKLTKKLYKQLRERKKNHLLSLKNSGIIQEYNGLKRCEALRNTIKDPNIRHKCHFPTTPNGVRFAELFDIKKDDLINGTMNHYEKQLQTEFIEQLETASRLNPSFHLMKKENIFYSALGRGVKLGIKANYERDSITATKMANFGWGVLEIIQGIGEGVFLGCYNFGNSLLHPVDTAINWANGICTMIYLVNKVTNIPSEIAHIAATQSFEEAGKEILRRYDQVQQTVMTCKNKLSEMSNREIAKQIAAFATESILEGQAFSFGFKVSAKAAPLLLKAAKNLRSVPVTKRLEKMRNFTKVLLQKSSGEGLLHVKKADTILNSRYIQKISHKARTLKEYFFNKKFPWKDKYAKIDLEHILGVEFKHQKNGKIVRLGGFHLDYGQYFEKNKILDYANKVLGKNGIYKVDLYSKGVRIAEKKTFYPSTWTPKKVADSIGEAYMNFIKSGATPLLKDDGKYIITGFCKDKIKIKMIITEVGKIVTAYPILK